MISQLYLTSYYEDLAQMIDGAATKLKKAKRGLLLPSEYNRSLRSLDPYASNHPAAPLVHLFLSILFWFLVATRGVLSFLWSIHCSVF